MSQREGKCGICEYQKVCGGSRARAYALTGNYLAEDPRCVYQPHMAEALAG
jgi:MoaA/NifB/PqqE/SkfB family radical SAM enzyme